MYLVLILIVLKRQSFGIIVKANAYIYLILIIPTMKGHGTHNACVLTANTSLVNNLRLCNNS